MPTVPKSVLAKDMSFRDYAAVAMLQAIMTKTGGTHSTGDAERAYNLADALIEARSRKPEKKRRIGAV